MKSAPPSGVASAFYTQNFGSEGNVPGSLQNEIDIGTCHEFGARIWLMWAAMQFVAI